MEFKDEKARTTYPQCREELKDAVYWCDQWAKKRRIPFVITRAIDEKIEGISISDTHKEGRAVDVSIKSWSADEIDEFIHDSNLEFSEKIGAVSLSDGKKRFCVFHVGTAAHMHLQIRRVI